VLIISESKVHFTSKDRDDEKSSPRIVLLDTTAFFPGGLETVARFVGMEKIKLGNRPDGEPWIAHMDQLEQEQPELFRRYALNDSIVLVKAFLKLREFFLARWRIDILKWHHAPTMPSLAMTILRDRMTQPAMKVAEQRVRCQRKLASGAYKPAISTMRFFDQTQYGIRYHALQAYWGGRRESFYRGLYDGSVVELDFISHYPTCGINQPLPNAATKWITTDDVGMIRKMEGFVTIRNWQFPADEEYPCLSQRYVTNGRLIATQKGEEATVTIYEFLIAVDYFGLKYDSVNATGFIPTENERDNPVRAILQMFSEMKAAAKQRCIEQETDYRDDLEYSQAKLMANALVGKFMAAIGGEENAVLMEFLTGLEFYGELRRQKTGMKQVAACFAPEWGALILGRARALLGLLFKLTHALSGHTDSSFAPDDPDVINRAIEKIHLLGGEVEVKDRLDAFFIIRSSLHVGLQKDQSKPGKWLIAEKPDAEGRMRMIGEAHHGVSMDDPKQFWQPVVDFLNGQPWLPPTLTKTRLGKPRTEIARGLRAGWEYRQSTIPRLSWDFKRRLPADYDLAEESLNPTWTRPYETESAAYQDESKYQRISRSIPEGRPTREQIREQKRLRCIQLHQKGWNLRAIAHELRVDHHTVKTWLTATEAGPQE